MPETDGLVDPQLTAFWASDPSILHPDEPATDSEDGRREHIRREIAAGIVVIAGLISRELLANRPEDPAQVQVLAHSAWRKHAPLWLRLVVPAIRRAYVLGRVEGLSGAELQVMAEDYATTLGDYVDTSSADALAEGFHLQLGEHWNERLAWHRAATGYGMDKRQMGSWVKGLMIGSRAGRTDPIPPVAKALADKALLVRADRVGADETHTASQTGLAISWLYLQRAGKLPATARREWDTAEDETVCPLCAPLDGVQVKLDEPFLLADGSKLWAPRAHPGCHCTVRLVGAEVVSKMVTTVAGLCVQAEDTGRVLMLQRANDPNDPAGGTWEFAGGHLEPADHGDPYKAAVREWEEENRRKLPAVRQHGMWWTNGYQGYVVEIAREDMIAPHTRGRVTNPDDPDGDEIEAVAWWDVEHLARNPAVRPELRASLAKVREAIGPISKAWSQQRHPRDSSGRWITFGELAPHERQAASLYHEQMVDDAVAGVGRTPDDYQYEVRREPVDQFLTRYMDAGDSFKQAYAPDEFAAHHRETLSQHAIPHYPAKRRWPVIVSDANPDYVDDGYHRFHSYMRAGATHIPVMRMRPKAISKSYGDDPYNRDAHGEFASTESRRLALRPVLEADPAIDALLSEIEQGRTAAAPSLLTQPSTLLAPSLLAQPSLLTQPSLLAQESLLGQESLLEQKQAVGRKQALRITIKLPTFPPRPEGDPDPFFLPYADVRSIEYEGSDSAVDHNVWFTPGAEANFTKYNETARFEAETAGDEGLTYADLEDEDTEQGVLGPDGPKLLHAQRGTGFRHLTEIFDSEQFDFWSEVQPEMREARDEARVAVDVVAADSGLKDSEIDHIFQLAGYDRRESIPKQRDRIVRAVQDPKIDASLTNAYADYVAYVRPDLVEDGPTCQVIARAMVDVDFDVTDAPIAQIFVFDKGLHPGDVPDTNGQVLIDHDYVVDGVEYIAADSDGDSPVAAYRLVYVSPAE